MRFAGVIMWAGVIHIDVVKSRIQADDPLNPRLFSVSFSFHGPFTRVAQYAKSLKITPPWAFSHSF